MLPVPLFKLCMVGGGVQAQCDALGVLLVIFDIAQLLVDPAQRRTKIAHVSSPQNTICAGLLNTSLALLQPLRPVQFLVCWLVSTSVEAAQERSPQTQYTPVEAKMARTKFKNIDVRRVS